MDYNSTDEKQVYSFLERTKKQAKRLFKLAKTNNLNITISSLAQAQELLAQMNGFPDWHALETTITTQKKSLIELELKEDFYTIEEIQDKIPVIRDENYLISFVNIQDFNFDNQGDFIRYFKEIIDNISYSYGTGFHEIELMIFNQKGVSQKFESNHFSSENNLLRSNKHLFEKIFKIHIENIDEDKFNMYATVIIKTKLEVMTEHTDFCNIFKKSGFNIKSKISQQEFDFFKNKKNPEDVSFKDYYPMKETLNIDLFYTTDADWSVHKKWTHTLAQMAKKKFNWKVKVNFINGELDIFYEKENMQSKEVYFSGLIKTLSFDYKNKNKYEDMFNYSEDKPSIGTNGITFLDSYNKSIFKYSNTSSNSNLNERESNNTLIFAKPGSGKSILLNMLNLSKTMNSSIEELPFIGVVDIGPSSKGCMNLIKNILPASHQHLVQYHRLKMVEEHSINVFDTQLGCRFPTAEERAFLSNFLLLLMSEAKEQHTQNGMTGLTQSVIDDMYLKFSDDISPKKYEKGLSVQVDKIINQINMQIDQNTTWWNVVDYLFTNQYFYEAKLAQRFAVPLLSDTLSSAQSDKIMSIYSKVMVSTDENCIQVFNRNILDALMQYQIISKPTVFDIDEAQIVAIDLDEVAKSGGYKSDKQTAIMYMLARYVLGRSLKLNVPMNQDIPYPSHMKNSTNSLVDLYREYHRKSLKTNSKCSKTLCFDEFHRVGSHTILKEQVIMDMREGRKWSIDITLASQSLKDFDNTMKSFANAIFIMDAGNEKDVKEIIEIFSIQDPRAQADLSKGKIHGPRGGKPGNFFAQFITPKETYYKIITLYMNNYLLTCLSTTAEDVWIKEKLMSEVGFERGMEIFVKNFPYGAKKAVEKIIDEDSRDSFLALKVVYSKINFNL